MTGEADFIVIRPGEGLPEGFLPPELDGRWYDRRMLPVRSTRREQGDGWGPPAVAVPTGRFEVRDDDGAIAEVWEVRP